MRVSRLTAVTRLALTAMLLLAAMLLRSRRAPMRATSDRSRSISPRPQAPPSSSPRRSRPVTSRPRSRPRYGGGLEIELGRGDGARDVRHAPARRRRRSKVRRRGRNRSSPAKQTLQLSGTLKDAEVQMDGDRATVITARRRRASSSRSSGSTGNWKVDVGAVHARRGHQRSREAAPRGRRRRRRG